MTLLESALERGPGLGVTLVQVTLVALLGLLAWLAARRGGPALRGAVLLAALVGLLVVPGLAAVAPIWLPLPEFAWLDSASPGPADPENSAPTLPPPRVPVPAAPAVPPAEPPGKPPPRLGDPEEQLDEFLQPVEAAEPVYSPSSPPDGAAPPVRTGALLGRPGRPAGVLAAVWLVGAFACLVIALARLALLYHWARRARPVRDRAWTDCLESLVERSGLPAVDLRESPAVNSPLTLGLFRRVILLPTARRAWSAEQRALILAHELAHVRRRDFLAGLVAELAACLCWFHPLVRWLAGRLRLEQEYTADAWAASAANDVMKYVRCLARLALELGQERGSLAPAFWRGRPEILRRIDMLRRNPHGHSPHLGPRAAWAVAALTAAACVTVAVHGDPLPAGAVARLGTTRWRHGATISYVAFGPDGKTLITAGQDNTVRLWDLATGKEIRRFGRTRVAETPPLRQLPDQKVQVDLMSIELRAATAQLRAKQAELEAAIRQREKASKIKPPADGNEKAQQDAKNAQLEAEKAQIALKKAQLEVQARQLAMMRGEPSGVTVAAAPDGKTLAVATANAIQLYDVETGNDLRKIDGPRTGLAALLFSPDGRTLAGRGRDGALLLWDAANGEEIQRLTASQPDDRDAVALKLQVAGLRGGADASGMAFAPDGKTLAVATTEFKQQTVSGSVKIWDVATGKETGQIKGPEGLGASCVAFTPDGKVLAYGAANVISLCEPDAGKELRQIKAPDGVISLVFSPNGKTLAVRGRNQQVRVWETETGKELFQLGDAAPAQPGGAVILARPGAVTPEVRNLAFSPDGQRLATASASTVRLWDCTTGKELLLSDGHQGPLAAVALSADGKTVVSWGADRTVRRWEAATGKPLGSFRPPQGTTVAAFSPDGRAVALAKAGNGIQFVDTATGKELHNLSGPPTGIGALAFSPDGKVLAARGGDNAVMLYDVARGSELRPIVAQAGNDTAAGNIVAIKVQGVLPAGARGGLVFSPDGKLLASAGGSSASLRPPAALPGARSPRITTDLYELMTGKLIRKLESAQPVVSLEFSPDGRVLATEFPDQSITLWEVASGKQRAQFGKVAASPQPNAAMGTIALAAGRVVAPAEPAGPVSLAFSPDGRALVSRGPGQSLRVWDVAAGEEVSKFEGHEGRVETIAFAPDGKTIASGSADTTILLWDAAALTKDLSKPELAELPDGALEPLWGDLAGEDAGKALQSVLKLAGAPRQAVPFLGERLKPAAPVDPRQVERWVADLESAKYAARQEAAVNLVKAGEQVVPALQKVLASQPTIETRKRVEDLLDKLTGGTPTAEQLRLVRAVEALERTGTSDARKLLRTLAEGAPGALATRQAEDALARLAGGQKSEVGGQ
jgi:WD40 repeat protein